jgi:hypothetical protein
MWIQETSQQTAEMINEIQKSSPGTLLTPKTPIHPELAALS